LDAVPSNEHDGIARVTKDRVTRASQNERLTHSVQLRGLIATVAQVTGYFEQFGITMPQRCGLDLKLNSGRNKSLPLARLCCVLRSADSNSFHRVWRATALRPFFITTLAPVSTRRADRRSHELTGRGSETVHLGPSPSHSFVFENVPAIFALTFCASNGFAASRTRLAYSDEIDSPDH